MYNKNQFKKTQEKKILRKKKKNWVIVSLSSFFLLGSISAMPNLGLTVKAQEGAQQHTSSSENQTPKQTTVDQEQSKQSVVEEPKTTSSTESLLHSEDLEIQPRSDNASATSQGVSDALADVQALKDNQVAGKTESETLTQEYITAYNLTYKGFVDGTNDGTDPDASFKNTRNDNTIDYTSSIYTSAYQQGQAFFNNTQGTRLVRTAEELRNAYLSSSTRKILVMNHISLWQLNGAVIGYGTSDAYYGPRQSYLPERELNIGFNNTNLTVDGRGKTVDYSSYSFQNNSVGNLTMKDITMYGGNFYGPTKNQGSGTLTYDNITYTGPQLISATATKVYVKNNVTVNGGQNYRPKEIPGLEAVNNGLAPDYVASQANLNQANPNAGSTQENMEVSSLTFLSGSHYVGSTFNGTALAINTNGNVVLESGAIVDLSPMGDGTSGAGSSPTGVAYGIYMPNGSMQVNEGAKINIKPQVNTAMQQQSNGYRNLAAAFYLNRGDVTLAKNAEFNVILDGPLASRNTDRVGVYIGGTMTLNAGKFKVIGQNLISNNNTLVNVTGKLEANDLSTLNVSAAGSGNVTLVQGAGMSIDSPSQVGAIFDIRGMQNSPNSKLFSGSNNLTSKNVGVDTGNGIVPYSSISFSMNGGDAVGSNMNGQNQKAFTYSNTSGSQTKFLQFAAIPTFQFSNDYSLSLDEQNNYVLNSSVRTEASNKIYNNANNSIYIKFLDKNGNVAFNPQYKNEENKNDQTSLYNLKLKNNPAYSDGTPIPFSLVLPQGFDLKELNNYKLQGKYVINDTTSNIVLTQSQIEDIISQKNRRQVDEGIKLFLDNILNKNYDPKSDSRYVNGSNFKLGYDAAKSGYENPSSKTVEYTNGTADYKYAYDKGQSERISLENQRSAAIDAINAEATKVNSSIDTDDTLNNEQKAAQKAEVTKQVEASQQAIKDAQNAQSVKDAQNTGITAIQSKHQSQKSVSEQQTDALAQIDAQKAQTLKDIADDKTLDDATRANQVAAVNTEAKKAEDAIKAAQNAQGIISATMQGKVQIDSQHVQGNTLESQRSAAIDAINAEATKVNSAIDTDDTLNNEQKAAQKAEVTKQVEASQQAIKDAQNAQSVKDAQNTGITAIQSKHQSQKSVSEQQTDALAQIDAQKAQTLKDIADDKTLDDATKANQVAAVNTEAKKAEDAIKAVQNAQGIIAATMQGKAQIDSQHVQGNTLESQRSAAIDAINAEATKVNSAIDTDDTLNNEQKAAQKAEVTKQVEASQQAIKDAQNAQSVKDAQNTGITAIQSKHQSQKSVSEQQTDALAQIDAQKAQTLKDIADDKTLDDATRANQVAAVNTEAKKAEDAIKAAKNAQGIISATMQGKAQIDSQHVQGNTLESQRSAAIDAINAEATKVNSAIDTDDTLNNEQKAAQKAEVTKQVEASQQAIKDAQNAQSVKDAQNTGITAIQSKHQSQKSVSEQQTDALAQIDAQKAQTLKDIADDKTLDDATKANQVAAVNTEAKKAEDAIKAVQNAQGIIAATMQGKAQIDSQHVQGNTLESQRSAAIDAINAEATKVNSAIDTDDTLNNEQKAAQKAEVTKQVEASQQAIKDAQKAQSIKDAQNTGITAIQSKHQSQKSVSEQQTDALAQIDAQKAQTLKDIADDKTLDDATKANQVAAVNTEAKKAEDAIKAAQNAQGIIAATMQGKAQIASQHQTNSESLLDQQVKAVKAINDQEAKVLADIEKDGTLDNAEKARQSKAASDRAKEARTAINTATKAQEIADAQTQGVTAIKAAHQSGKAVSDQQTKATEDIDQQVNTTVTAIRGDNSLTDAEKTTQINAAQKAGEDAKVAIGKANDAQTISNAINDGKANIIKQHQPGSLDGKKALALDSIDAAETQTLADIEKDGTLDNAEKARQSKAASDRAKEARTAINTATKAQEIVDAQTQGVTAIKAAHQSGKAVSDQQTKATEDIEKQLNDTVTLITGDNSLTDAQKATQIEAAKKAAEDAKTAIKQAYDAQTISNAVNDGKANIIKQYQTANLELQRTSAIKAIENQAIETLKAIDADQTLSPIEKSNQSKNVNTVAEKVKNDIKNALTSQNILDLKNLGIENIVAQHKSNSTIYDPNPTENQLLNEKSKAIYEVKDYPNSDFYINKIKQATTFNDIRSILEESRNQSKTKEVHYVPGYGVQQWILTEKGTFTQDNGVYIPTSTTVKIFNEKIVAGIKYVQIKSKNSNQWIQAQYIESGSYQAVHYVPGYGVRIRTIMDNQATPLTGSDSLIPTGETIKVLDKERVINGDTYVQIGSTSENRWIQKKYLQDPVLKEVNYVKGYGVQNWMIDNQGQAQAIFGSYTPSQSFITTFDTIVSDGISYTRIGSADKNIWVQTQYLN
ncbi:hypothetical protein R4Y45_00670 [Holzapfeliella sp. He02]|uniref:DUF1542 domain-containing protein n=1 Tax=Holzapfeliella saturejae TaxID=3082953 RepID=A0ABU8SFJ1_9LACO